MGTLYIDRKDVHIRLDGNVLAFYAENKREGMVPITPLKRVVVIGNIDFETRALNKLADMNVTVIFLSGRRLQFHGMLHGRLHNNGFLRLKQYEKAFSGFPNEFSLDLVHRKIKSQSSLLNEALQVRPDLRSSITNADTTLNGIANIIIEIKSNLEKHNIKVTEGFLDSIRGYEGSAASAYFSAYTTIFPESLHFKHRNKRPPRDPVNAMLSLCYTMIHYESVREIETIGLDPTIGFYHQFKYGRESLACDIVELIRPDVDRFVWSLFREKEFTARDFAYETERSGCYLKKPGRQKFYPVYENWAKGIRQMIVEEVRKLAYNISDGHIDESEFLKEDDYGMQGVKDG